MRRIVCAMRDSNGMDITVDVNHYDNVVINMLFEALCDYAAKYDFPKPKLLEEVWREVE